MKLFNFSEDQDDPYNSIKGRPYELSSISSIQNYEMYDNQESSTEYELHEDNDRLLQNQSCANLIPINALNNSKFQSIFPYKCFNLIQSECFNECYNSDENMVVSAPTGSGKTLIFELAILRLLSNDLRQIAKVVYIAPTKALCDERVKDWNKFGELGFSCSLLTGDTQFDQTSNIMKSNIIVTTPEKWDSITRQWDDTKNLMDHIGLLLVDEIHMLKDGIRGATLEVVISRMKSLRKLSKTNQLRIVAVSATVPNLEDFSQWLQDNNGNPATIKKFDESFRPIKLVKHVFGYPLTGNQFSFEDNLKFKLMELITRYSNSKPSLIFCSTRKSATRSAEFLVSEATQTPKNPFLDTGNRKQLELESQNIIDKKLSGYVSNGIAYHHGGLVYSDRKLVETLYIQGILKCICTTSTLAVGVNLPAHLVIIKGTSQYDFNQSKVCEYSDLDVLQMMGRAGRPQFDDHGTVVVMTTSDRRAYYENMISGTEVIESSLHLSLIEHLNAETTLGMIKNNSMAIDWLKSTFLYIRIQKNPSVYQLKNCTKQNAKLTAENRLQAIFVKDIELLRDTRLVTMNQFHGDIMSTEYGKIMARYYMKFQTISNFIFLPEGCRLRDLFECMCRAEEFNEIRFHSDKGFLNKLNKDLNIKFPIKGRVCELYQKVSLCIQATLSGLSLTDSTKNSTTHSLSSDANLILKSINRVNRGMLAIFMEKKDYISLHCALIISQALTCRMWKDSSFQLRQIEGLGPQYVKILTNSGITTFSQLLQTESTRIEMILNRSAPFGNKVLTYTKSLPKITMKCTQINTDMKTNHHYIDVKVAIKSNNVTKMMTRIKTTPIMFHLIVGTTNGQLIDCRKFKAEQLETLQEVNLKILLSDTREIVKFSLICNEICGVDVESELIPVTTHLKPFINVTKRPLSNAQVSKHFSTPKRSKSTETDDEFLWGDLDEHDLINVLNEDLLTPDPTPKVAKVSRNKSKRVTNQIQNLDDSDFFDLSTPTSYDINLDENLCKELNYVPSTTFKFVKESGITKKDKTQIERNKPHIQKLKDSISNTPVGFINRRTLENMANSSVRCTTPINTISEPLRTQENIIQCDLPEFSPSLSVQPEDVPKLDRQESLNSTTTIYKVRLPSESIDLNIQSLETNTQDEIDWDDWITNLDTPESIPLVKLPITTDTSKESDQRNIELMKNIFADMF